MTRPRMAVLSLLVLASCRPPERQIHYLPLDPGRRWVLRSPASPTPIVLEVLAAKEGEARLRFDNPWIPSELRLLSRDGRVYLTGLTMNGQTAELPPGTLYWDTAAPEKHQWASSIGHYQVVSRHKRVRAMGRDFENCIEIEETNLKGNQLNWIFAPDTGFVQFGEGKDAFVLVSAASPAAPRAAGIRVGLAANPFANEGYDSRSVQARFRQARKAGVNLIYLSPKWNEIETSREN